MLCGTPILLTTCSKNRLAVAVGDNGEPIAGAQEAAGHAMAHDPDTDETDPGPVFPRRRCHRDQPPSMICVVPVVKRVSSDAR